MGPPSGWGRSPARLVPPAPHDTSHSSHLAWRSDVPWLSRIFAFVGATCRNRSRPGVGQFYITVPATGESSHVPTLNAMRMAMRN